MTYGDGSTAPLIERSQPAEVFKTTDGRLFEDAEEAHCHERHIQLRWLVTNYAQSTPITPSEWGVLDKHLGPLANHVAGIVRDTPLANA